MKLALFLLATATLASSISIPIKDDVLEANKDLLLKQKFVLEMLTNIHQELLIDEYLPFVDSLVVSKDKYTSFEDVLRLFRLIDTGLMLPKGRIFTLMDRDILEQTTAVIDLFMNSVDIDTLMKNVIWAREHINEGMFVYALTFTVIHSDDMHGIVLPPLYEIMPNYFFTADVLEKGKIYKMTGKHHIDRTYTVPVDYTSAYHMDVFGEQKLAYFTEDIGLNTFYHYFNLDYPFWLDSKKLDLDVDRRGELFLFMHQQLLARYYLERLSNDLGEIRDLNMLKGIDTGYWPMLRHYNGIEVPLREDMCSVDKMDTELVRLINDWEIRIRDVIDSGILIVDGVKIDLTKKDGIDILGRMMQGTLADKEKTKFLGYVQIFAHLLVGGRRDMDKYFVVPSVMENFMTAMRDPVFYQLYKKILRHYLQYKETLPTYTTEELLVNDMEIVDVQVDDMVTFFDWFKIDASNVIPNDITSKNDVMIGDMDFHLYQPRLNHEDFDVKIKVNAKTTGKHVVRMFLGPKVLNRYQLNDVRENFVEIDQFLYEFTDGINTITRNSDDFKWLVDDRTTTLDLYKNVMMAINERDTVILDNTEAHCGFPKRLLLPKGKIGGMPLTLFVMISKYIAPKNVEYSTFDKRVTCGVGSGSRYIDDLPFGFPLDRKIDVLDFFVPNMYFKDVVIYEDKTRSLGMGKIPLPTVHVPLNCADLEVKGLINWLVKSKVNVPKTMLICGDVKDIDDMRTTIRKDVFVKHPEVMRMPLFTDEDILRDDTTTLVDRRIKIKDMNEKKNFRRPDIDRKTMIDTPVVNFLVDEDIETTNPWMIKKMTWANRGGKIRDAIMDEKRKWMHEDTMVDTPFVNLMRKDTTDKMRKKNDKHMMKDKLTKTWMKKDDMIKKDHITKPWMVRDDLTETDRITKPWMHRDDMIMDKRIGMMDRMDTGRMIKDDLIHGKDIRYGKLYDTKKDMYDRDTIYGKKHDLHNYGYTMKDRMDTDYINYEPLYKKNYVRDDGTKMLMPWDRTTY